MDLIIAAILVTLSPVLIPDDPPPGQTQETYYEAPAPTAPENQGLSRSAPPAEQAQSGRSSSSNRRD